MSKKIKEEKSVEWVGTQGTIDELRATIRGNLPDTSLRASFLNTLGFLEQQLKTMYQIGYHAGIRACASKASEWDGIITKHTLGDLLLLQFKLIDKKDLRKPKPLKRTRGNRKV